jgi:hypothetical protein
MLKILCFIQLASSWTMEVQPLIPGYMYKFDHVPSVVRYSAVAEQILRDYWHGYVLHEGITYKSRVPRTSQMTSRLLCHTAAAVRAHNVLCNSYNTRPLLCARITCYVTVITVEINHCSFRRVRFALLYIVTRSKIVIMYFHSSKLVYHGIPNTHRCTTHPW